MSDRALSAGRAAEQSVQASCTEGETHTSFPVRLLSRLVGRNEAHSSKNDEMRALDDLALSYAATMHGFFSVPLTRWERIRQWCSWAYIRQTRLLLPLTEWWLNRGGDAL